MLRPSSRKAVEERCRIAAHRREFCLEQSEAGVGASDDNCLIEQLEEKRCVSTILCPVESCAFYGSDQNTKEICALWAESFAYTEVTSDKVPLELQTDHMQARNYVNEDARRRAQCRIIVQNLSKCMHKHTMGKPS